MLFIWSSNTIQWNIPQRYFSFHFKMFINSTFRNCLKKVRRQHINSNSAKPVSGIRLVLSNIQGHYIPQLRSRILANNIFIVKLYLQTWSAGRECDNHSRLSLYLTYISVVDILFWQSNSHKVPYHLTADLWCIIKKILFHLSNPKIE